jgi:hypothetical protein
MDNTENSECQTPKQEQQKIPTPILCPSPPRKKRQTVKSRDPPPGGFFKPPELEIILAKINKRLSRSRSFVSE